MKESLGTTGLILNEPLLWEKGKKGRSGFSLPRRDVEYFEIDKKLIGDPPDFPDLSEVDVIRHYTRLSQWNFGVDTGMYPLGSCTMKYNPKINERQAGLKGFAGSHPLLPADLSQGILRMIFELEQFLAEITGMDMVSLQPAAGRSGRICRDAADLCLSQKQRIKAFKDYCPGYSSRNKSSQCCIMRIQPSSGKIK